MTRTTMSMKDNFPTSEFRLKSCAAETLLTTSAKFLPELVGLSPPLCANGCEFATDSRFLGCCDLLGEHLLQVCSPRGRATSDRAGTNQAKMGLELALENDRIAKRTVMKADCCHRFLPAVSLCALLSGCAYPVKISCPAEASIHPALRTSSPI